MITVSLQTDPLDEATVRKLVSEDSLGAVLLFHGVVRNHHGGRSVSHIDYQSYPAMAEAELRRVAGDSLARHPVDRIALFHRVGIVRVGEASLLLGVGSRHRAAAFACALEIVDEIKRRVPIWKREYGPDGAFWVEGVLPGASLGEEPSQGVPKRW